MSRFWTKFCQGLFHVHASHVFGIILIPYSKVDMRATSAWTLGLVWDIVVVQNLLPDRLTYHRFSNFLGGLLAAVLGWLWGRFHHYGAAAHCEDWARQWANTTYAVVTTRVALLDRLMVSCPLWQWRVSRKLNVSGPTLYCMFDPLFNKESHCGEFVREFLFVVTLKYDLW